jgi:hypothetical protein
MTNAGNQQQDQAPQQGFANIQQLVQSMLQSALAQQQNWAGMGAFGQQGYGQHGGQQGFGNQGWGGQQRQLSQQDVFSIVQQIAPALPQLIAQAQAQQQQPLGAYGYAGSQRLSAQDINEVVRQILPVLPQLLQSAQNNGSNSQQQGFGQQGFGQQGSGQQGYGQAAYSQNGQNAQQRQFSQQDISEIVRQVSEALPQVISAQQNGQQNSQQRC